MDASAFSVSQKSPPRLLKPPTLIKSMNFPLDFVEDDIQEFPTDLTENAPTSWLVLGSTIMAIMRRQATHPTTGFFAASIVLHQICGLPILKYFLATCKLCIGWYFLQLQAAPLITKSITSGVIGICGDYMAQVLEFKLKERRRRQSKKTHFTNWWDRLSIRGTYNKRRGLAILCDGFFISGPLMHWAYDAFEHVLPITGHLSALVHVVADWLLLDSVLVATAFVITGLLEGYGFFRDIVPQFRSDFPGALKASWTTSLTLMPLEYVCFRYLPVSFRTLAMSVTDVIWDAVVSFMAHKNRKVIDTHEATSPEIIAAAA